MSDITQENYVNLRYRGSYHMFLSNEENLCALCANPEAYPYHRALDYPHYYASKNFVKWCTLCGDVENSKLHVSEQDDNAAVLELVEIANAKEPPNEVQQILLECIKLLGVKNLDYRHPGSENFLHNFVQAERFGTPAWIGALCRMSDKWERIVTLTYKLQKNGDGPAVKDESLEDTLMDIVNYGAIVLALYRQWKTSNERS